MSAPHLSMPEPAPGGPVSRRPVLGIALSGGAAYGAAHAGVLQVLDTAGFCASVVVGTSAGAIVGVGYAAGLPVDELVAYVEAADWSTFARWPIDPMPGPDGRGPAPAQMHADPPAGRRWGLLDPTPLELAVDERLGARLGVQRVEDLPRRFAAVAYDLRARQPVLLTNGPLGTVLRASSAVPGLFPPVAYDGRLLVDGSLAVGVPVRGARLLGADIVVGVTLTPRRPRSQLTGRLRRVLAGRPPEQPDLLIEPDTGRLTRWTPADVPTLVEAGRTAAREALDVLPELINDWQDPAVDGSPAASP